MIKSIEFREGVLTLAVALPRRSASSERYCRIELDFGEGGTIPEFHRGQFVYLLDAVYPKGASKVENLILELLGTETRISRIYFDLFYRSSESLEGSATSDIQVQFPSGAVECAGSEEDIPF